ncbi:hypothetical protein [Fuchsiella alkaliacetigena]|uniref:hypothetical protein n=1 Tax=Fuchsiella alkaliacetigena TaxID=957042 RepID=UPI00200A1F0A|nr:hypothetical protein [Fuchsiella alkaliacetigena]MCK8825956.1 hypothetical protein [Fuchsiella alkaliacetigena]
MEYKVVHKFEQEEGVVDSLETNDFKRKYRDKLLNWERAKEFSQALFKVYQDSKKWE